MQPKKPASLCREPKGECDLPEYCDGASEFCPPDVYVQDGKSCKSGQVSTALCRLIINEACCGILGQSGDNLYLRRLKQRISSFVLTQRKVETPQPFPYAESQEALSEAEC